jgi:hypothetical protein
MDIRYTAFSVNMSNSHSIRYKCSVNATHLMQYNETEFRGTDSGIRIRTALSVNIALA